MNSARDFGDRSLVLGVRASRRGVVPAGADIRGRSMAGSWFRQAFVGFLVLAGACSDGRRADTDREGRVGVQQQSLTGADPGSQSRHLA